MAECAEVQTDKMVKVVRMRNKPVSQCYLIPTVIITRNYMGRRYYVAWLYWCLEF